MAIGYDNLDLVTDLVENLNSLDYVADPAIATSLHLAQMLGRPLLIEGRAGVGKTQIAATMSQLLDTELIRLQCYEGLDVNAALYEWNYPKQLLWIRMNESGNLSTSEMETEQVVNALQLPSAVSTVLGNSGKLFEVARKYAASEHFLFLGRGLGYPVALEGALKLKEVSYIHAEGYSAGEMKHGPIALVDDALPTVAVCTRGDVHEKMLSNVEQIKARGGRVITLVSDGDDSFDKLSNDSITLPDVDPALGPIPSIVALQLLAYGIARERGLDIAQPRNLAKTVTVE